MKKFFASPQNNSTFSTKPSIFTKPILKTLSVILAVVLVFQVMQVAVFSIPMPIRRAIAGGLSMMMDAVQPPGLDMDNDEHDALIVMELLDMREEFVRHFRREDGLYVAVMYSQPVHVLSEDGTWEDISATLLFDEEDGVFATEASPNPVRLPLHFGDGQRASLTAGGRTISFGISERNFLTVAEPEPEIIIEEPIEIPQDEIEYEPVDEPAAPEDIADDDEYDSDITEEYFVEEYAVLTAIEPAQAEEVVAYEPVVRAARRPRNARVIETEEALAFVETEQIEVVPMQLLTELEQIRQANDEFVRVEPTASAIVFENAFDGADLEFLITPDALHESIVLHEQQDTYTFTFDIDLDGLLPAAQADGSIALFCPDTLELVAVMETPHMQDADGETSHAVRMELVDGMLTLTADEDWVNAEEREWPVAVHTTTFTALPTNNQVSITYHSNHPTLRGFIGRHNPDSAAVIGWAHMTFPIEFMLPPGATYTGAFVRTLVSNPSSRNVMSVHLLDEHVNPLVPEQELASWGTQSFFLFTNAGTAGHFNVPVHLNITNALSHWRYHEQTQGRLTVVAADNLLSRGHITLNEQHTHFMVTYSLNVGIESYWSFEGIDLGYSGHVHVNRHNGLLTFVHPTMQLQGNRMPFGFDHVFASQRAYLPGVQRAMGSGFFGVLSDLAESIGNPPLEITNQVPIPMVMSFMENIQRNPSGLGYRLIDGTGAVHYFIFPKEDDNGNFLAGVYLHEHNRNLVLEVVDASTIIITDERGTTRFFEQEQSGLTGALVAIEDVNGNRTTINFGMIEAIDANGQMFKINLEDLPSVEAETFEQTILAFAMALAEMGFQSFRNYTGLIRSVTDPAGREIKFEYDFLNPIILFGEDPDCPDIQEYISNDPELQAVLQLLSAYIPTNLSAIVHPDGSQIAFSYDLDDPARGIHSDGIKHITDTDGRSTSIRFSGDERQGELERGSSAFQRVGHRIDYIDATDGSRLQIYYASEDPNAINFHRVIGLIHQCTTTSEVIQAMLFEYEHGLTKVHDLSLVDLSDLENIDMDDAPVRSFVFDDWGRQINSWDENRVATYRQYNFIGGEGDLSAPSVISAAVPLIENLARNHSFELFEDGLLRDWQQLTRGQGYIPLQVTNEAAHMGEYSLLVANPAQASSTIAWQNHDNLSPGAYTLSAYVFVPEMLENSTAYLRVVASRDGLTGIFSSDVQAYIPIHFTNGWVRRSVTIEVPESWSNFTLQIQLAVEGGEGYALFDAVQLERGRSANDYNLLDSGMFVNHAEQFVSLPFWMPASVEGTPIAAAQPVRVNAQAGQTLVFNAYANAENANPEGFFGVGLVGHDGDVLVDEDGQLAVALFEPMVRGRGQMAGGALRLAEDTEYVALVLIYDGQFSPATFYGAALYVGDFGESFAYDDSGRLVGVRNSLGSGMQFVFNPSNDTPNPDAIRHTHNGQTLQEIEIEYDERGNITRTYTVGIATYFTYGSYGTITEVMSVAGDLVTRESMTYTPCWNFLASYTDARGMTSYFDFCVLSGRLLSTTDPNGNQITHTFDGESHTVGSFGSSISFNEIGGLLDNITRGDGLSYNFLRDNLGRVAGIAIGDHQLVQNTYGIRHRLEQQHFANGAHVQYIYDHMDRIVGELWDGELVFAYEYNLRGQLSRIIDHQNNVTWDFHYDVSGRLASMVGSDGTQAQFAHDLRSNNLSRLTVSQNGAIISDVEYEYAEDGRPISAILHSLGGIFVDYDFDALNRLQYMQLGNLQRSYAFTDTEHSAGDLIERLLIQLQDETRWEYTLTHDDLGNIRTITDVDGYITRFSYDGLNRLVREDNERFNRTKQYVYDTAGNIISTTTHAFTLNDNPGLVLQTVPNSFDNPNWPDQMTAHNGNAITYDAMGNPLTYNGLSFAWQHGRQLAGVSGNGQDITFRYDADGRRTQRVVNGVVTNYTWVEGLLIRRQTGDETIDWAHDADGVPLGFRLNGDVFFYVYNVLGDVVAIVCEAGNVVAEYAYDAYGNILYMSGELAEINPIRYRGYYFDDTVGLYYLHTRWYNPHWGRFLNADVYLIAGNALTANNLYQYANGNPIRYVDPTGELAGLILAVRIVSVVVGIVGGILSGFATARRLADRRGGANGWTIFGGIVVGLTIAGIGAVGVWQAPAIAGFLYGAWQWVLKGIAAVLLVVFGIDIGGGGDEPGDDDPPPPPTGGAVRCPPLADVVRGTAAQYLAMGIGYFIQAPINNANFISSRFEPRWGSFHLGIDITTGTAGQIKNRNLIAVTSGYVENVNTDRTLSQGYSISFRSDTLKDPRTGHYLIFTYMHMQNAPTLRRNDPVAKGQVLGQVGNSPDPEFHPNGTLGPNYHLHFEISNSGTVWGPNGCCDVDRNHSRVQNRINPIFFYPVGTFRGTTTVWNEVRGRDRNCNC